MNTKCFTGFPLVLLTISLSLGIFMNVLDSSIANVAIPSIAGDIGVSPDQGTWIITSFAVSSAIVIPLTGWLARRFGEVRLFVGATFLFTIVSMLCGLSRNLPILVTFRVIQGAVAGPMIPLSQSLLLAHYPEDKKGLATALWAMTAVVAPIVGPILGGWLTYDYSWPWIFYINLPVGLFSAYFTWYLLHDRETPIVKQPIDIVGLCLLISGVGCLQVLLDQGRDLDWFNSTTIDVLAIIVVVSLTFLIIWELTDRYPIVDLQLFKRRNFTVGTITLSLGYMAFFGNIVILPLWLQTQMGYTATWAGFAAAPIGILPLFLSPIVGQYINKIDLRILAGFSFLVFAAVSFWNTGFTTDVSFMQIAVPRFIQGVALATFFIPLISIVISGLPPQHIASALGLANFLRILGGGIGTSLTLTLWDRRERFHEAHLTEYVNNYNFYSEQYLQKIHYLGLKGLPAYQLIDNIIENQAYMLATNDFFWFVGCLFMGLFTLVWFAKPPFTSAGGPSSGAH